MVFIAINTSIDRYHVDRRKSVDVLKAFMSKESDKLAEEVSWLRSQSVDCVLSDAAYLAWCVVYTNLL